MTESTQPVEPPRPTILSVDPGGVFSEVQVDGASIIGTCGKPSLRVAGDLFDRGLWTEAIKEAQTPVEVYVRQEVRKALEQDPAVTDVDAALEDRGVRSWMPHPRNGRLKKLYADTLGPVEELPGWTDGRLTECVRRRNRATHAGVRLGEADARESIDLLRALVDTVEHHAATSRK